MHTKKEKKKEKKQAVAPLPTSFVFLLEFTLREFVRSLYIYNMYIYILTQPEVLRSSSAEREKESERAAKENSCVYILE